MGDNEKRMVRILVRCAEIRGKYAGELYSASTTQIRDVLVEVAAEIEAILIGEPAPATDSDAEDNFDAFKSSSQVAS